ncbi:MAG: hypothetical protein DRN04_14385 [Thermoprotei archaeon]|nr:MAG: hypothetical protein DRN04_14385 [Thermoprotei archaeon]
MRNHSEEIEVLRRLFHCFADVVFDNLSYVAIGLEQSFGHVYAKIYILEREALDHIVDTVNKLKDIEIESNNIKICYVGTAIDEEYGIPVISIRFSLKYKKKGDEE